MLAVPVSVSRVCDVVPSPAGLWLLSTSMPVAGCGTCFSAWLLQGRSWLGWGEKKGPFTWVNWYVLQPCFPITCVATSSMPAKAGEVEMLKADHAGPAAEGNADPAVSKEPVCPYTVLWFSFWWLEFFYLFLAPSPHNANDISSWFWFFISFRVSTFSK